MVLTGDVSAVEYALKQVTRTLGEMMRFTACPITRRNLMKRIMLIGPSQCGKRRSRSACAERCSTIRRPVPVWSPTTIDTPGEYLENRCLYSALLASACSGHYCAGTQCRRAVVTISPGFTGPMNRPVIGLVTKADLANPQRISLVESC